CNSISQPSNRVHWRDSWAKYPERSPALSASQRFVRMPRPHAWQAIPQGIFLYLTPIVTSFFYFFLQN
ncbi:MAG: hypothetical protein KDA72_15625, partial [Planctomycetales bacterium]|nr:hypothetical protein [Planctomycetales bacterium]